MKVLFGISYCTYVHVTHPLQVPKMLMSATSALSGRSTPTSLSPGILSMAITAPATFVDLHSTTDRETTLMRAFLLPVLPMMKLPRPMEDAHFSTRYL